jgi:hypothetical protein
MILIAYIVFVAGLPDHVYRIAYGSQTNSRRSVYFRPIHFLTFVNFE